MSKKKNLKEAAKNLYKTLRKIKKQKFKSIAVTKIPNVGIGCAINDRLRKASSKWIIYQLKLAIWTNSTAMSKQLKI